MDVNDPDEPSQFCCGSMKSPHDSSDWIFERLARAPPNLFLSEFPDEFDLQQYAQPPRNQGRRDTCAGFVAATIKEIQENRDCGFNEWMSPEFIYYHRENKPSDGMYPRDVFKILQKIGSVPEVVFPYSSDGNIPPPSDKIYKLAENFKIANYARVTTINGVKRALLELGPCLLLLPLYKSRPEFWKPTDDEKPRGGHAVTIIGYNATGFKLMNSWGDDWNGNGYIIYPYSDWNLHWECWVSVDEKTNGINIESYNQWNEYIDFVDKSVDEKLTCDHVGGESDDSNSSERECTDDKKINIRETQGKCPAKVKKNKKRKCMIM